MSDTKYDDIIGLPHYEPKYHQRMPMANRAAQFAPFAALTGHGAAIDETARLTDRMQELSDEQQLDLSRKLAYAYNKHEAVTIRHFIPDTRKEGGHYEEATGTIKKIDETERKVHLTDGRVIEMDRMTALYGHIFDTFF